MTLLDVVMAHAARSPNQPGHEQSPGVVTIEMKTSFLRPGLGRLVARGRLLHRSTTLAFCDALLYDGAGQVAAHASGTFKYLRGLPAGGRKIQRLDASD
jgi:acyl-coenzyme A thioesterase PaaI-like protein